MCDMKEIQSEYITTDLSLPELGKKHGISVYTLQARSKKEGWVAKRKAFKQNAIEVAVQNAVADEADRLGKIITSAQQMADVIEGVFKDKKQFYRHVVQDELDGDRITVEKTFEKADSRAIKDLTGALKDMTLVLRNLYNLPTQAEAEAQRIASERLKLEQRKADADSNGEGKRIEVVLADGWDALAK